MPPAGTAACKSVIGYSGSLGVTQTRPFAVIHRGKQGDGRNPVRIIMYTEETRDNDTLGGRIWRAREASGFSAAKFARALGVKKETLSAWENDRSEPRANKLVTMAGILSVSPAWLLHGIGEQPSEIGVSDELMILQAQLERIKELREQTDIAIGYMEKAISRIADQEQERQS